MPITPWMNSEAKEILRKDILEGKIDGMTAKAVYVMHEEYKDYNVTNFTQNLGNLCQAIRKDQGRAVADAAAFAHDRSDQVRPCPPKALRGYDH